MTLTELAARTGIDRSALTNIANDAIGLGKIRAKRIAKALKVPLEEVWQPPAEDAASRRDLDRRLRSVQADADEAWLVLEALLTALRDAGIQVPLPPEVRRLAGGEPPASPGGEP